MTEATIIQSPHAFVPKENLTEEEREERYRTRIDESFKPYTVVDVLTKVYHRVFSDDLRQVVGEHSDRFRKNQDDMEDWAVSNVWVNSCRLIRPESIFNQYLNDFKVDILVEAKIRIEEARRGRDSIRRRYDIKQQYRLRYTFNLTPCKLTCVFSDLVLHERAALINRPNAIRMDKYLLPVLKDEKDYLYLAKCVIDEYYPGIGDKDVPVDPAVWIPYWLRSQSKIVAVAVTDCQIVSGTALSAADTLKFLSINNSFFCPDIISFFDSGGICSGVVFASSRVFCIPV